MPKRRDSSVLRVEWKISLPAELAARIEMTLYSPHQRKPQYGGRSQLIERLLREHLAQIEANSNAG